MVSRCCFVAVPSRCIVAVFAAVCGCGLLLYVLSLWLRVVVLLLFLIGVLLLFLLVFVVAACCCVVAVVVVLEAWCRTELGLPQIDTSIHRRTDRYADSY